jgi:hypothetical protein
MLLAGFEPVIPVCERPQIYALDRAATGIGPFAFENMKPQMFNCLTKVSSILLRNAVLQHFNIKIQSLIDDTKINKQVIVCSEISR